MNSSNDRPLQPVSSGEDNKRPVLITLIIALVLIGAIWVWKSITISNLKEKSATEQLVLKKQASDQIMKTHSEHLKLLAKPFVWALRTEMLQGNFNQVNLYMNDMVKERNIQMIIIANAKGVVIASTNKKDEGQLFATIAKDGPENADLVTIVTDGNLLTMTSPIMGFSNRLGTLLIRYAVPDLKLN